jgi:15-cis-phytoene desaturase
MSVAVFERSEILGGRAASWKDEKTGVPIHIGPHILLSAYPNMKKLMTLLGTTHHVDWLASNFIRLVDGERFYEVKAAPLPPPFHFLPSMITDPNLSTRDLLSNTRVALYAMRMSPEDIRYLDVMNAVSFLRRMGVSWNMIHRFWTFICMSILNVPLELCSAGALMRFFQLMLGHSDTVFGLPKVGLGDLFAPQAVDYLRERGGSVHLKTEVKGFLVEEGECRGLQLSRNRTVRAKSVIATLPPQALRALVAPEWAGYKFVQDLSVFEPCPYIASYLFFDRKLSDMKFWARVHRPTDLNCDFYDLSNINPEVFGSNSMITSNIIYCHRAEHLSDAQVVQATLAELRENLPSAREAKLVHSVVNRIPMAIHCPFPGTESARPPVNTPIPGFYLAGDWVQTGVPSSMEGAVRAGWVAAEQVLASRGVTLRFAEEAEPLRGLTGVVNRVRGRLPRRRGWVQRMGAGA